MNQSVGVGLNHTPYGSDSPYQDEPEGRFPRDPMAGDVVYVKVTTWPIQPGQSVWIVWTKNEVPQEQLDASWKYNSGSNSYWEVAFPSFERGDRIQYYVWAEFRATSSNPVNLGPFLFHVTSLSRVTAVTGYQDNGTSIDVYVGDSAGSFAPVIRYAFPNPDSFRVQVSPTGQGLDSAGEDDVPANAVGQSAYQVESTDKTLVIRTEALKLEIRKDPYQLFVYKLDGTLIVQQQDPAVFPNVTWASDGRNTINRIADHFVATSGERFMGFGERYDVFDQRGREVLTYVYNEYLNQAETHRTYLPVPFFSSTAGYGVYLATTARSVFNVDSGKSSTSAVGEMATRPSPASASTVPNMLGFSVHTSDGRDSKLDYHVFTGTPKHILDRFTRLTARPRLPPKWALGLWMSAHGWNTQEWVTQTLDTAETLDIPATVLVLEQWSDEATFYIWHGAEYEPVPGGQALHYEDFEFPSDGRWPNPRAMVEDAHRRGVRVMLWQIPVFKEVFTGNPSVPPAQHLVDKAWAVTQGYTVGDGTQGQYRIDPGRWFGSSMVPDFTHQAASDWWFSKRKYLVDEIGIDGFKTDGGEALFGRCLRFNDGRRGDVMHNGYPASYIDAYRRFLEQQNENGDHSPQDFTLLSRAGVAGAQALSIYWAGDQESKFKAFAEAIRAGLTAGLSGVPFWGWDLAGFSGPLPSCELYLRAAAMATFCPMMEFHSEQDFIDNGDHNSDGIGVPQERTPWNIAAQHPDDPLHTKVVPIFRWLANVRMNLLPYIYTEAKRCADTGIPLMRAMYVEFPNDPEVASLETQYMFGNQLLVRPVVRSGASRVDLYMPGGTWHDLWSTDTFVGPGTKRCPVPIDTIPVWVRPGTILPLNLDETFQLGSSVGNSVTEYANLTFRIYPDGAASYEFYEDVGDTVYTVKAETDWTTGTVRVVLLGDENHPSLPVTLQVMLRTTGSVTWNGDELDQVEQLEDLAVGRWYRDPIRQSTFVQLSALDGAVLLSGVSKADLAGLVK